MLNLLFFLLGLFIGWCFFPVPQFVLTLRKKLVRKFPWLGAYTRD